MCFTFLIELVLRIRILSSTCEGIAMKSEGKSGPASLIEAVKSEPSWKKKPDTNAVKPNEPFHGAWKREAAQDGQTVRFSNGDVSILIPAALPPRPCD